MMGRKNLLAPYTTAFVCAVWVLCVGFMCFVRVVCVVCVLFIVSGLCAV